MKAIVFDRPGGSEQLKEREVEDPKPGPSEVLVRVAYCGVNPIDRIVLAGTFPARPMPHILGGEIGGRVEALGEAVQEFREGQEVIVYNRLFDGLCPSCLAGHEETCEKVGIVGVVTQGGYAEYAVVPARNVLPLPKGANLEAATATASSGLTAYHMVLSRARTSRGEWVCVLGARGGVGCFAVQLAHLAGAQVIAVTRDEGGAGSLRELGAQEVVVDQGEAMTRRVMDITGGRGADVVVDPLGKTTWPHSFAAVARNGRWTTCGVLTGGEVGLNLMSLYSKQIELIGSTGGDRRELRILLEMVAEKQLKVPIARRYPLKEAPRALEALGSGDRMGKVLLELG